MTPLLSFEVSGVPAPQGSKRGGVSSKTGKTFVYEQNSKTQSNWRQDVLRAAKEARAAGCLDIVEGAVWLRVEFRLPRPASVSIRKRPHPAVKPDVDKLLRNTMDGLTQAQVYRDDAQVVALQVSKRYATDDPEGSPGATIWVGVVPAPEII
jgi:Holliday junction resolvase RusA-like endonuclease